MAKQNGGRIGAGTGSKSAGASKGVGTGSSSRLNLGGTGGLPSKSFKMSSGNNRTSFSPAGGAKPK